MAHPPQPLVGLLLALAAAGCDALAPPRPAPPHTDVQPVVPAPTEHRVTAWWSSLPSTPVRAAVGNRVWATAPTDSPTRAAPRLYTVRAIRGHHATLTDVAGRRRTGVPGALIHAIRTPPAQSGPWLETGDVVLSESAHGHATLARVASAHVGKPVMVRVLTGRGVREEPADHVEAPRGGRSPLAFVWQPGSGPRRKRGQIVAIDGARAWVRGGTGEVVSAALESLVPANARVDEPAVGTAVRAHRWGYGAEAARVVAIVAPGLHYRVAWPDGDARDVPFWALEAP